MDKRTCSIDACHPWTAALTADGYGWMKYGKSQKGAHLVTWELENGPKPKGAEIDHECHNQAIRDGTCLPGVCRHRRCCNLKHLVLRASAAEHNAASPGQRMKRNLRRKAS